MRPRLRLGVRTRLLLAVVGAVALALAIGVAAFNLLLGQRLSDSAIALAKAQAVAEISSLKVVDGKLVVPEGPDEGAALGSPVWVFAGTTAIETPRIAHSITAAAASLAGGPERALRVNETMRLYALPVLQQGKRVGTVVAGVPLHPYDETETIALVGSVALAVALLAAVTVLTRWILGRALLPVSLMTKDAAAWSDHDLDRRFGLGEPYDELTRLACTLDALLERLAASLRHEQRFTAELSHELRTPLAKIAAETELALRRERSGDDYRASLEAVRRSAEQMTRTVEALVSAARQDAGLTRTTSDARDGVRAAVASVQDGADAGGVRITLALPDAPVRVAIEDGLVERIIQPLLDNAVRYGRSSVSVEVLRNGATVLVSVVDDGDGVGADERERIFEPGVRGSAAAAEPGGAGLGLALAQRLARSAGGEISAEHDGAGGRFVVRLPVA
ncbi:Histidine kinase-, DNA gyrase B-, and HSP90-like ATPase [Gaiella occulta]|uniref:histidine kinase n=1 Tax=Gaiella occulta TaxID=1002870 RepID=A0A7M2Z2J0_9ACTN|nr:ATP-binding protein [Gaiella occulta]RDI76192.1 Histidine kinase-, DNA gyrase B-, and HSP90-like ATPase [Gaiella occulta]